MMGREESMSRSEESESEVRRRVRADVILGGRVVRSRGVTGCAVVVGVIRRERRRALGGWRVVLVAEDFGRRLAAEAAT